MSNKINGYEVSSTLQVLPTLPPPTPIPSKTPVPTETPTPTETPPLPTPTEHGVNNPLGIIPAGMPAIVDGYVMVVDPSGLVVDGDYIGFSIQVKTLSETGQLFRYNASTLRLRDNLGNQYNYYYNIGFNNKCTESDLYLAKQIMVEPEEEIIIEPQSSMMFSSYFWWCLKDHDKDIPGFIGSIPHDAESLFLEFSGFGPFTGFEYQFDI